MSDQEPADQTADQPPAPTGALTARSAPTHKWLSILHQVTDGAISHLDLRLLLRDLLERIRDAMDVDNAAILLLTDDERSLTVYAGRGAEEQVAGDLQVPVGRGVAGMIAASAAPVIIEDLSHIEVEDPLLRSTARSLVGVPLLTHDRVIGVLHLDSAQPRRFTQDDVDLLQVIAGRIALAIEHARLYEAERAARQEAEAATRQLRMLQAVSDVGLAHAQLHDLVRALLKTIQEMMDVDNVAILLPTSDGTALTLYSVHGPEEAVMGRVRVPMGEGVAGRIAATRAPYIVENLKQVPVSNPFLRKHFVSLLGLPLLNGDHLVGVIHVDTAYARRFTEQESQLLQVVADRIALAIDRARTYETEQQTREEAESKVAALQETTRRMDEFLGIASHELRTPITSLNTNLQLLDYWLNGSGQQGNAAPGNARKDADTVLRVAGPVVQRCIRSMARLDRLVGDLLDASRIRESHVQLRLEHVDLVALIRELGEEQQQVHPNRQLDLRVHAPAPLLVQVDVDRIGQVVANYVSNAFKYSRPGHPVVIQVEADGAWGKVSVRDHGTGIPLDAQELIWDRFYRVPGIAHQSDSRVGLGLGLYICRDIVRRHGGRVGVTSAPGKGSTFWFALPLAPDPAHDTPPDGAAPGQGA